MRRLWIFSEDSVWVFCACCRRFCRAITALGTSKWKCMMAACRSNSWFRSSFSIFESSSFSVHAAATYLESRFEGRPAEQPQQLEDVAAAGDFVSVDESVEVCFVDVLLQSSLELAELHLGEVGSFLVVFFSLRLESLAEVVPEVFDGVDLVRLEDFCGVAEVVDVFDVFRSFDLGESGRP